MFINIKRFGKRMWPRNRNIYMGVGKNDAKINSVSQNDDYTGE